MGPNTDAPAQPADPLLGRRWGKRMEALFAPKTIALIGASEEPRSVGRGLTENLQG